LHSIGESCLSMSVPIGMLEDAVAALAVHPEATYLVLQALTSLPAVFQVRMSITALVPPLALADDERDAQRVVALAAFAAAAWRGPPALGTLAPATLANVPRLPAAAPGATLARITPGPLPIAIPITIALPRAFTLALPASAPLPGLLATWAAPRMSTVISLTPAILQAVLLPGAVLPTLPLSVSELLTDLSVQASGHTFASAGIACWAAGLMAAGLMAAVIPCYNLTAAAAMFLSMAASSTLASHFTWRARVLGLIHHCRKTTHIHWTGTIAESCSILLNFHWTDATDLRAVTSSLSLPLPLTPFWRRTGLLFC